MKHGPANLPYAKVIIVADEVEVDKIDRAHSHIRGTDVARMIVDFQQEFGRVYGVDTLTCPLCMVGPLQSLIGHAIKNGLLAIGPALEPKP